MAGRKKSSPVDMSRYDEVFLQCKAYTHNWVPLVTYVDTHGRTRLHRQVLICAREQDAGVPMPTEKEQITYANGKRAGQLANTPRYTSPDGYKTVGVGRGHWKAAARVETILRQLENGTNVVRMKKGA